MTTIDALQSHFSGKTVLVTGHTGFKGAWLTEWLLALEADVVGVALPPTTRPALFEQLDLEPRIDHRVLDLRHKEPLVQLLTDTEPDVVLHLAAQSLVRYSYEHPVETFATNIMGSVHLLEGVRQLPGSCEVVVVTTDKCYENHGYAEPYTEDAPMGGHDPYSASKGALEVIVSSYRRSFFDPKRYGTDHKIALATARAGNVIGGGDWATDRIVPDSIRALREGDPVTVRNPGAVRPWQHVLEPLGGYLSLAHKLASTASADERIRIFNAFNFGPDPSAARPVSDLVDKITELWPGSWIHESTDDHYHEAGYLSLSITKAHELLGWSPVWDFDTAVEKTVNWYRALQENPGDIEHLTKEQISSYSRLLADS